MWNDKETDIDLLGYKTLAQTIESIIRETELCPLTIGVYGNWGAGKSSILKMIEKELKDDDKTACITFNGWLFQGYDETKTVVMEAIINELTKQQPWNEKLQEGAKKLFRRVDWLKLTRQVAGIAFTGFTGLPDPALIYSIGERFNSVISDPANALSAEQIGSLKESFKTSIKDKIEERNVPEEINGFRKDFEELLKTAKIDRLVVLVDDLDRCIPETAIAILEAIRLFLYVPGTIFILAADENMIAYAVRKHFPDLPASVGPADYTRNYLEKLIQLPFRVPPLGKTETRTYITLLLAEYALRDKPDEIEKIRALAGEVFARPWEGKELDENLIKSKLGTISEKLKESLLLSNRISAALAEGLNGNPRQLKRFLNTLMVRLRMAETQGISTLINKDVLAKLMLLERFDESVFSEVLALVAQSENGFNRQILEFEKFVKSEEEDSNDAKKKKKSEAKFPESWKENAWLVAWGNIEPSLGSNDLRPYFYISREKSPGFSTNIGLSVELNQIAEKLAAGNPMFIAGLTSQLKAINLSDAKKVFQYLSERAKQNSDWKTRPKEIEGIYALCKLHPELQDDLVSLFDNLPVSTLGSWIATGTKTLITHGSAKQKFEALLNEWGNQKENIILKSAVESLSNL